MLKKIDQRPKISCYIKFLVTWKKKKKDLNARAKSIKCLGNLGVNWQFGIGNGLLDMTPKA